MAKKEKVNVLAKRRVTQKPKTKTEVAAPVTYGFVTLPHKSVDANGLLTLHGQIKPYAPCTKLELTKTLEEVHVTDAKLKQVMAYTLCRVKLPAGTRRVINTSAYSGGNRLALCKGTGSSCIAVISNTGKQLTFQARGTVLSLPALDDFAVSLGLTQINDVGGKEKSFCAYSHNDVDKAKKLVDKAMDLITK